MNASRMGPDACASAVHPNTLPPRISGGVVSPLDPSLRSSVIAAILLARWRVFAYHLSAQEASRELHSPRRRQSIEPGPRCPRKRPPAYTCGRTAMRVPLIVGCLMAALLPRAIDARVVRLVIEQREPLAGGVSWGTAGPYERIVGTAHMEVDPRDPRNAVIVDLDLAPRNARGLVEFSTTFFILKPIDPARGNGKIYYTVNNRGNDALFGARTVAQVGRNDLALRLGYTIVDAGWQGDLIPGTTWLGTVLPVAVQPDGSPLVGTVRVEFSDQNIPPQGTFTLSLKGSAAFRPYEAAVTDTSRARLVVRDTPASAPSVVPGDHWAFGTCPAGRSSLSASAADVCLFEGFKTTKLYELIYPAKNPIVMGLGHAT